MALTGPVRGLLVVVLAAVALTVTACSDPGRSASRRVALFGDSLSWEAEPYFTSIMHSAREAALIYDSYGGTAICDWFPRMQEVEQQYHPTEVVLQFSGNALTSCMQGYETGTPQYYAKYRSDTLTALNIFLPGGARVVLVGAPVTRQQYESEPGWQALNDQYAQIAASQRHVTYFDAGAAVEGPRHSYVATLPCLVKEPCHGPVVDGVRSNVVRSSDGIHFCPVAHADSTGIIGNCPVYSSGAYRFADAMVTGLRLPGG